MENEGIVSTVQCNRVISHGQDPPPPPPPPMPMQRSFSDLDLRPQRPPPKPEPKKLYVELSPHLDVEYEKPKKKTPKFELVPTHIFQYYVKSLHREAKKPKARATSPTPQGAFSEMAPEPFVVTQTDQAGQPRPPAPTESSLRRPFAPQSPKAATKGKKVIDPKVPKHWWQYNHPGRLVEDKGYAPSSPTVGYNESVQHVIEKRYVADQVEEDPQEEVVNNPIYAQVERRGIQRHSSKRSTPRDSFMAPSWISEYEYATPPNQPRPVSLGNRESDFLITGANVHMVN